MNFGSLPIFNGKKVVLEDDTRLSGGTPTAVPGDTTFTAAADKQTLAFVPIVVTGTLVINGTVVNL